jgi:hypothetical protein
MRAIPATTSGSDVGSGTASSVTSPVVWRLEVSQAYGLATAKVPVGETPVQSKRSNVRPTWLAGFTSAAKVSSSVPPRRLASQKLVSAQHTSTNRPYSGVRRTSGHAVSHRDQRQQC